MNFEEFAAYICEHILTGWKDHAWAEIQETKKNNGVIYKGLYIREEDSYLSPAVYLEEYYDGYLHGQSISDIIDDIRKQYEWSMSRIGTFNCDFSDYSKVKHKIIYRLVNYELNQDIMAECPHIRLDDLAVTFRLISHRDNVGISTVLITHYELGLWGVGLQDILLEAQKNTERIFPMKILPIESFLRDLFSDWQEQESSMPMYIVTNEQQINGATVLLYQDFLKRFSRDYPGDYYILPSSIHELIMIPACQVDEPEGLLRIVEEANMAVVKDTEILSDSVYYYDALKNSICNICYAP